MLILIYKMKMQIQMNNVQENVENLDEGNETDSDNELVWNSIIESRLDRSVRERGWTRNRRR